MTNHIPTEQTNLFKVELSLSYLDCLKESLLIRDWQYRPIEGRTYLITDEEIEEECRELLALQKTLKKLSFDRKRHRQLAIEYATVAFANVYLLCFDTAFTSEEAALKALKSIRVTRSEFKKIIDRAEVLCYQLYEDNEELWRECQLPDIKRLYREIFTENEQKMECSLYPL